MKSLSYRPEIEGLRAVAVLFVILFHVGLDSFPGGFTGVDIFYVISGYLITSILIRGLEGEFSFAGFYTRRIKRLFPAAIFMVTCVVLFGVFILTPDKFITLSKSAISANLFVANFWFMQHSGYFDQDTAIAPLAHMWSLSVEEQFYLLFPVLIYCTYRFWKNYGIKVLIISTLIISFSLSVFCSSKFPNFAFYMLPTRAWQLGLGAAIAITPIRFQGNKLFGNILSLFGLAAILYGAIELTKNNLFPGTWALFPTIGAALILYFSRDDRNLVKGFLSLPPMVLIGRISYSTYLWHWPIVVYYRTYVNERDFSLIESILLLGTSLIVGYISWKCIEEKFRYSSLNSKKTFAYAMNTGLVVILLSGIVMFFDGFPGRMSQDYLKITDDKLMWEWNCTEKIKIFPEIDGSFCVVGEPWETAKTKGIIWGDSHSVVWAPIIHEAALEIGASLVVAPQHCPPYINSEYVKSYYPKFPNFTERCTTRNKMALDWVNRFDDIDLIVMAAAWSGHVRMLYTDTETSNKSNTLLSEKSSKIGSELFENAFTSLLKKLGDKEILILGDFPRPNKTINECAGNQLSTILREKCDPAYYRSLNYNEVSEWHKFSDQVIRNIANEYENVNAIFPSETLCDESNCHTYYNGEFLYMDENHIRRNISEETRRKLSESLGLNKYFISTLGG